jgi:hypothetical protein
MPNSQYLGSFGDTPPSIHLLIKIELRELGSLILDNTFSSSKPHRPNRTKNLVTMALTDRILTFSQSARDFEYVCP